MDNYENINPEYVYLTIPSEWVGIYHRILISLADTFNINKCCSCNVQTENVINCWNMFQSALASRTLGDLDSANKIIDYLNNVLEYIYKGTDKDIYDKSIILPISDDGKLKAIVTYDNNYPTFKVDLTTGKLYQIWKENQIKDKNFIIKDNSLFVNKKD